jgi:hypothetical protein
MQRGMESGSDSSRQLRQFFLIDAIYYKHPIILKKVFSEESAYEQLSELT